MNFFKRFNKKQTSEFSPNDFVSYLWRNEKRYGYVKSVKEDGEYEFPTKESRILDEPIWVPKQMVTIMIEEFPFVRHMPASDVHKLTDPEIMLYKLENA